MREDILLIENMKIHKVVTYANPVQIIPRKINFFYGSNGSGKTTISRLLSTHLTSDNCEIVSNHTTDVKVLVYNKNFVEDNFKQSDNLKGIFTLGQDSIEAQEKLQDLQKANLDCQKGINTKSETIEGFETEITEKKSELINKCWKLQQSIGDSFSKALVGYRNNKQKFQEKCMASYETWDKISTVNLEELKAKYDVAFSQSSAIYSIFATINLPESLKYETSDLLVKVITGSTESPLGQLIDALKNSDWIQQGLGYMNATKNKCPFCQQEMTTELQKDIESYFDEAYEKDCQSLNLFISNYNQYYTNLLSHIKKIIDTNIEIIDTAELEIEYQLLESLLKLNQEELEKKKNSPSNKVVLDSSEELLKKINTIIEAFNTSILNNNNIVKNQKQEQSNCTELLWQYIATELKEDIESYLTFFNGKNTAKASISKQILGLRTTMKNNKSQMEAIEDSLTSVIPTVNEINKILQKFDFRGFSLKENEQLKGTYLILRDDGSNARENLSEGELNFITFLYFYYLVYGSQEKTGISSEKIIVIDDPISSLDSNVLFIVSTLVKNLLKDCRKNEKGILQTFILTHNVYFHKEVTFLGSREQYSPADVLFGVIRKKDNASYISEYPNNPIESTYQLLWRELGDDNLSTVTSFNTMRRILEYYFKIIGDMDYEKCIDEFDGHDKIICKALVSCINDGSHFVSDDFVITFDHENIDNYKRIFELIFEKLGHKQHYEMMMKTPN